MNQTKNYKKHKKNFFNKTRRQYGGLAKDEMIPSVSTPTPTSKPTPQNKPIIPNEGVLDMVGDAFKNTQEYAIDKLVRMLGYQRIPKDGDDDNSTNKLFVMPSILTNSANIASKIASSALKTADRGSSSIIQKLNVFLADPNTSQTVLESGKQTQDILYNLLKKFNDTLNGPILKQEFIITITILGEYAKIFVSAMDGPINESMDLINKAITRAISGVSSGAVKVVTDLAGAVPFAGPIIDLGKAVNDGSKSIGSVVNAGTDAINAASLLIGTTSENMMKPLQELQAKKQQAEEIVNRAQNSINQFQQPFKQLQEPLTNTKGGVNNIKVGPVTKKTLKNKKRFLQ